MSQFGHGTGDVAVQADPQSTLPYLLPEVVADDGVPGLVVRGGAKQALRVVRRTYPFVRRPFSRTVNLHFDHSHRAWIGSQAESGAAACGGRTPPVLTFAATRALPPETCFRGNHGGNRVVVTVKRPGRVPRCVLAHCVPDVGRNGCGTPEMLGQVRGDGKPAELRSF